MHGSMETTITLLHSTHYSKQTPLENYYSQLFHQRNMIIKEQNKKVKNQLELTYNTQLQHSLV